MSRVVLLVRKQLHELRWAVVLCWLMLSALFVLGSYLYRTFGDTNAEAMARVSPQLIVGLFGGLLGALSPLEMWLVTLFLHPLAITLYTVVTVALASRALAGEIERGTLDLLLSCPVSRSELVTATVVSIQLVQVLLTLSVWGAVHAGLAIGGIERPESMERFAWVTVNLWALFAATAGVALLLSAISSEQGKAIGRTIAFVVLSFFVNLLASLWPKVRWLDVGSIFHYHQPQPIVAGEESVFGDLAVLLGLAAVATIAAYRVFAQRDIAAP